MAKKRRRRRRMNGCLKCLITLVIIFVIFAGALYGGATFAWGKYVQPQVDITLNEALSVVGGLYFYKEKNIVTKPYGSQDEKAFYQNMADTLYLDKSIDLKKSLTSVVDSLIEGMVNNNNNNNNNDNNENEQSAMSLEENSSVTGNEAVDKFLTDLKFDFSRLKDYEDEYTTPQVLQLTDKQVAAFLDSTISYALNQEYLTSKVEEAVKTKITLSNIVKIPQAIVEVKNDKGIKKTAITLTVKINIRSVAKEYLSSMNLGFLSILLPKSIFGTITIYPDDVDKASDIKLNDFNQKKMGVLYKLANLAFVNSSYGSMEGFLAMINNKCIEIIDKVQSIVPVYFVETGSIEAKPVTALMKMMKITEITETQFFCMIRDVFLPTFDDISQDLGFASGTKREDIDNLSNSAVNAFIGEIEGKYAINHGYLTTSNMFDSLTSIGGEESDLIKNINIGNLSFENEEYVPDECKVSVGYLAFANLINGKLNSDPNLNSMNIKILNMTYDKTQNKLAMIIEVGVQSSLNLDSTESAFSQLIQQLIPKNIYMAAIVDLDDSTGELSINGKSVEQTQAHLNTMMSIASSLGMDLSSFNYETLIDNICQSLTSGLSQIEDQLGTNIVFKENNALLPSIYDVLSGSILKSDVEGAKNLTSAEVYQVVRSAYVLPSEFEQTNKAQNISSFVTELNTKYAISTSHSLSSEVETPLLTQITNLSTSYNEAIDGNKLKTNLSSWNNNLTSTQKEAAILNNYSPIAREGEFAKLLSDAVVINIDGAQNVELHQLNIIDENTIQLIYNCDYSLDDTSQYKNFIPNFVINVLLDLSKINTEEECCFVTINAMNSEVLENFGIMATRIGAANLDVSTLPTRIDTMVKDSMQESLSKVKFTLVSDDPQTQEDEAKIYLSSIFDITYNNIMTEDEDKANYKPYDIADTFAALYKAPGEDPITHNVIAHAQSNITTTPPDYYEPNVSWQGSTLHVNLTARNIGAAILSGDSINSLKSEMGVENMTLHQIAVLKGSDTLNAQEKSALLSDFSRSASEYSSLNSLNVILATFRISTSGFGFNSTMLPSDIYFTAIINLQSLKQDPDNTLNQIVDVKLWYNDLSSKEINVLRKMSLVGAQPGEEAQSLNRVATENRMGRVLGDVVLFNIVDPIHENNVLASIKMKDAISGGYGSVVSTVENNNICGEYNITYTYTS